MKTLEELKNYYDTTLINDVKMLEEDRKRVAKKALPVIILGIITVITGVILFFLNPIIGTILFTGGLLLGFLIYSKITKNYKSDFKTIIIKQIINFIDKNLSYNPINYVSKGEYLASKIFKSRVDRYKGDDLVTGKIGETTLKFSELHTQYRTTDSKGRTQYHTIFKGIFFIADFNKKFKGKTFVLPDIAQKIFGNMLGNLFQSWNKKRGELIKTEDLDFEKKFVVYGNDQVEARYILSTSLMKRITDYSSKTNKKIFLSFINNKIYVAISYFKNLFEPKIFKTLLDFDLIQGYYDDLVIAVSIVEDLNLNTRIWG